MKASEPDQRFTKKGFSMNSINQSSFEHPSAAAVRSHPSRGVHLMERIGLAMIGASCGLFVAAYLSRAGIEVLCSVGVIFAVTACGAVGFYLGIDIPPRPPFAWKPDAAELLSATGTFLAAAAALISVCSIVIDADPLSLETLAIGAGWTLGLAMQVTAGVIGRIRS
jgi:hypothetical protein